MRTKICLLLLVVALLMSGCSITKETHRETVMVDAVVVSCDYDPPWYQPVWTGKTASMIYHPADYDVTVEYDGMVATFDSETLYNAYKNRVGTTIKVNLVTIYYENGETRCRLERID